MRAFAAIIAAAALLAFAVPARAQRSTADGLRECEHFAAVQFKRENPAFRRFAIDQASAEEDKFADKVGTQFVSTVYHGRATYEAASGPISVRFICLHAGVGKGPVFVYSLPE
jgi:hypothetical protein